MTLSTPKGAASFPLGAYREALERAQEMARTRSSVVAVGFGFKRSRRHGFGPRLRPCLKFSVTRKRPRIAPGEAIPKFITVPYAGRNYRILTDVENRAYASEQQAVDGCRLEGSSRFGTPGFLAREGDNVFLVTAAHVLRGPGAASVQQGDRVTVDGVFVGLLHGPLSQIQVPVASGRQMDFAAVLLDKPLAAPLQQIFTQPPWATVLTFVSTADMIDLVSQGLQPRYTVFGVRRHHRAHLVTGYLGAFELTVALAGGGQQSRTYPPVILWSRTEQGEPPFCGGDSGAPLIGEDRFYGIHFLGKSPVNGCSSGGFAVSAESIFRALEMTAGTSFSLVTAASI